MDGYPPDRCWVYDRLYPGRGGVKPSFAKGVEEFILKARVQPEVASNGGIRCPCDICKFRSILSEREVKVHLYRFGFQPNYWYWTEHGEKAPQVHPVNVPSSSGQMDNDDPFTLMQHMVDDAFRPTYDFQSMGDVGNEEDEEDIHEDDEDIHEEPPNADAQDFYDLLTAANEPIYEGASESKLSICVKLLACKTNWNIPQKCLDFIASMLGDVCPSKEKLPKKIYQAKRLVSMLGLESQKIDCCVKGCMLYYKDDSAERQCKFCQEPRYVPRKTGMGKYNDVPAKRMFYLPITPRLKRLYASTETATEMRWHSHNRSGSDILRHPSDGEAWKHFDAVYPDFANEPRNVRLGLCSDGFTPYIQASTTPYSCWPVVVTPYNLPPEMCMTKPFMFLTCLVPGPSNPKEKIDVFLQPLIDELQQLWSEGVLTYDTSKKQNFQMRASLMWTINDFPAYGMLSGWGTQGKLACPICMDDTKSFRLKYGGENSWFDCHRRFLPREHKFRRSKKRFTKNRVEKHGPPVILTGDIIWNWVSGVPSVVEDGKVEKLPEYGRSHNWIKRSIFWDLPYWKDNLLRHNLDVMHIEKNVFDNVFITVMNDKGRTKDNEKARMDLALICQRSDLELIPKANGKMTKPKASYCLSSDEAKNVMKWMKEIKMPDGYASNLARCADVNRGKLYGMKSHDCHVFMECLLPFAFSSLPDLVWRPLTELSQFFKGLCSNNLSQNDLIKLNENIPLILCKLERIFPPGFFDSMEHLPIHLPHEAMLGGPVQYRWMYPFERMMGDFKRSVKNKARVKGSICMSYLQRETTYFCSHYFKTIDLYAKSQRNEAASLNDDVTSTLSISNGLGRPSGQSNAHWLSDAEWRSAHVHILINCIEVKPYMEFIPGKVASKAITAVIQSQFREPYHSWGEIPGKTVEKWLEKFQEHVSWDPKDHYLVEKLFKTKGSKRLSEMLMEVRKNGKKPTWIGEGAYAELNAKWKAPDYKEKCTKAKQNRASSKGGSMHTGGSISITEHALRLSDELGREPMVDEIFLKTHTKKKDKSWVDNRSRETYEAYQEKVQQAASQASDGGEASGSVDPSAQLQLWAQSAGGRTRGRLYGVGGLSGRFRHGVSSLTQESRASGTSTQSPTQYSTEVAAQIAAFEERTRKAEEEAREAREEAREAREEAREARKKAEEEAQEAREARRIASERDQQFQRQLRELSASVAAIQAHKSRRRHPDYEESEEDD